MDFKGIITHAPKASDSRVILQGGKKVKIMLQDEVKELSQDASTTAVSCSEGITQEVCLDYGAERQFAINLVSTGGPVALKSGLDATFKGGFFEQEQSSSPLMNLIIPTASAQSTKTRSNGYKFKNKVPCVLQQGKTCLDIKAYVNKRLPKGTKLPSNLKKNISLITEIENMTQDQVRLTMDAQKKIYQLHTQADEMLLLQKANDIHINKVRRKMGNRAFAFAQKRKLFMNKMEANVKRSIASSKINPKIVFETLHIDARIQRTVDIENSFKDVGEAAEDYNFDNSKFDERDIIRQMNKKVKIVESEEATDPKNAKRRSQDKVGRDKKKKKEIISEDDKNIFKAISNRFIKSGFKLLGIEEDEE